MLFCWVFSGSCCAVLKQLMLPDLQLCFYWEGGCLLGKSCQLI